MSIEERMEFHDQWLRSLESSHSQIVADLAATDRRLTQLTELVFTLGQNQAALMGALASLTSRVDDLTAKVDRIAEHHLKLEETLERYIRFRGNGGQKN